jgi:YfiH family protein
MTADWIVPDWPAPARVRALSTTRNGGCSQGPYRSLNLGAHCGDEPEAVARNRALLRAAVPDEPLWLRQVHSAGVLVHAGRPAAIPGEPPEADARVARAPGLVCVVLAADCLPVLLCDQAGTEVAAAHAGWRGLAAGVLERTVRAMRTPPANLIVWLGPSIGAAAYEVGADVRQAFAVHETEGAAAFQPRGSRWLLDLPAMARHCLARAGVSRVFGGHWCTHAEPGRFFSHRRDRVCGRMASLVWLD